MAVVVGLRLQMVTTAFRSGHWKSGQMDLRRYLRSGRWSESLSGLQAHSNPAKARVNPLRSSFCCFDFLPFSLLCFVLSPWRGEAGGGGGKVGGGGCLASLAPPIQTSFHLRKVTLIKGPVRLVKMIKGGQKGGG